MRRWGTWADEELLLAVLLLLLLLLGLRGLPVLNLRLGVDMDASESGGGRLIETHSAPLMLFRKS